MSRSITSYLQINPKARMSDVLVFNFTRPERPGTYVVTDAYCINPDCDCKLVSLRIQELPEEDGSVDPEPAECFLHLETRQLMDARGKPVVPPRDSLLADFQTELSEEGLSLWRKHYAQAREYGREHFWDPLAFEDLGAGDMPAWHELQPGAGSPTIREGGQRLALVDHYCLSPVCHCHEVLLGVVVLNPEVAQRLDSAQQQLLLSQTSQAHKSQAHQSHPPQSQGQKSQPALRGKTGASASPLSAALPTAQALATHIKAADLEGDEPEAILRISLKGHVRVEDPGPFPEAFLEKLVNRYLRDIKQKKELTRRYHEAKKKGLVLAELFPSLAEAWRMKQDNLPPTVGTGDAVPAGSPDGAEEGDAAPGLLDALASASLKTPAPARTRGR